MELRDMGGNAFAQEYGALPAPLGARSQQKIHRHPITLGLN